MPSTRTQRARTLVRASVPWRKAMPHRAVTRTVQGVTLSLPWSHLLPDYARSSPQYGQNLVELAVHLAAALDGPLLFLDVGANIGDSTAQVLARTDARALCVEADPYWQRYLDANVGRDERVTIVEALLAADSDPWQGGTVLRHGGTSSFVPGAATAADLETISPAALRAQQPTFDQLRLVKSDTDGHDVALVPAVAEAWSDVGPVLFFEFDPVLSQRAGRDVGQLWDGLERLGYDRLAVWDNGGDPVGQVTIDRAAAEAEVLARGPRELGYTFWDVAACRGDDAVATAAFDALIPR